MTYRSVQKLKMDAIIHFQLRRDIRQVRKKLLLWKDHPGKQFEVLQPIYQSMVYQTRKRTKQSAVEVEALIDRILNRLIKSRWSVLVAFGKLGIRAGLCLIGLFISIVTLFAVFEEFDKTSFTVEPIKESIASFSETAGQWLDGVEWETETEATPEIVPPSNAKKMNPHSKHYRLPEQITTAEELGEAMAYHMNRQEQEFTVQFIGDINQFSRASDGAWKWLEKNEPYVFSMYDGGESEYLDYDYYVDYTFRFKYEVTPEQAQQVRRKVNQIVKKIPVDWSDEQKIRYVNDYVVRHTTYRLKSKESPYTPYSILMNGEGVCDGYALTTLLLLEAAGVEVRYIDGKVSSGLHAWNMVKAKGNWYHLDTTWNDPIPNRPDEVQEDYLMVSDKTLLKDHSWIKSKYPKTAPVDYAEN
ncbi:hypothetical protein ESP131_16375 [Exiguobacterium sp. U13-1]|nr:hypothetical protein ESP131_16375 [Exiguobacterium sp. U13-1]